MTLRQNKNKHCVKPKTNTASSQKQTLGEINTDSRIKQTLHQSKNTTSIQNQTLRQTKNKHASIQK